MIRKLQCIGYRVALFTFLIACDKDSDTNTSGNSTPPPLPPSGSPLAPKECDSRFRATINVQLVPVGKLSMARRGMAVAAVGNKILLAGSGVSRVDIYDVTTNTVSTAELSLARYDLTAVAAGNKVFFAGGYAEQVVNPGQTNVVDIYNAADNTWSVARLSKSRSFIAAAAVGNKVIFAGGEGSRGVTAATVDIYDQVTGTWSVAELKAARQNISAITLHDKIYFAGGYWLDQAWDANPSNLIDIYDQATGSWSTAALQRNMGNITGVAVGDHIYWASRCDVEIMNVQTGQSKDSYLFARGVWTSAYGQQAVVRNNKVIFFRHEYENAKRFDIYDIATDTWSIGEVPVEIFGTSIIAVNNTIYLAGGRINGTLTDQVWRLEL